jgi:hypothetical protein
MVLSAGGAAGAPSHTIRIAIRQVMKIDLLTPSTLRIGLPVIMRVAIEFRP